MQQVRENKSLVREQKPLKNSPSCIVESLAGVSCVEDAPFPTALAEECSAISLRAWVRPRGCQKYMPSPALSYVCPQQLSTWAESISTNTAIGAAVGCSVQLCSSSISPLFYLRSLISNWIADVLLIVWPANLIRSLKKVCFYCWQIKLLCNYLTDEELASRCPSLLALCHMDRLRNKTKSTDKSPWNKTGLIHRSFPAELTFARTVKLHKICNTDICWHTGCVLISACLFWGNIFSHVHSACPTLLQQHTATPGHSPTSWQSCPVKSFWDNLPPKNSV